MHIIICIEADAYNYMHHSRNMHRRLDAYNYMHLERYARGEEMNAAGLMEFQQTLIRSLGGGEGVDGTQV